MVEGLTCFRIGIRKREKEGRKGALLVLEKAPGFIVSAD
jgi:hypothetical protein